MSIVRIGIDPGKKGGYAVLIDGECWRAEAWNDDDFTECMRQVSQMTTVARAVVEKVGAMPGQGVTSMFSFGKSAGFIEGVLKAFDIPYQLIPPSVWKKEFSLTHDKSQSIAVCKRLFPSVSLLPTDRCKKESDGIGEALLMAEYARRKL